MSGTFNMSTVLDEADSPRFPAIESWLDLVFDIASPGDVGDLQARERDGDVLSRSGDEDDDALLESPSTSPRLSIFTDNREHSAHSAPTSRSWLQQSLKSEIRDDEAVSRQWEEKDKLEVLDEATCSCLQLTASLLGDVGAINNRSHSMELADLLEFSRKAAADCHTTLNCKQCVSTRPANAMLLCMTSKYISILYERIVLAYDMKRRTAIIESRYDNESSAEEESDFDEDDEDVVEYRLSEDRIVDEETAIKLQASLKSTPNRRRRLLMLRSIISFQLSAFSPCVTRLREEPLEGEGCDSLLSEAEGRIRRLRGQMERQTDLPVR